MKMRAAQDILAVWTYRQSSGAISRAGVQTGIGYSGFAAAKNNPAMQSVANAGPIPRGNYAIGAPIDLEGGPSGPYVLPLTPNPANQMFGRFGFLIHGDSIVQPGTASRGCVILSRAIRETIAASGDRELTVVE